MTFQLRASGENPQPRKSGLHALYAEYDAIWQEMLEDNDRPRDPSEPEVIVEVDPSLPDMDQRLLVNQLASKQLGLKDNFGAAFTPLGDGRWRAWPRISKRGEEIRERLDAVRAKINEHGEQDFEAALRAALGERMKGDVEGAGIAGAMNDEPAQGLAVDVYRALSNVEWRHEDGSRYSCSWRSAGGLVAEIRGAGEDYLDFYCSGREGTVTDEIAEALSAHGWHPEADDAS